MSTNQDSSDPDYDTLHPFTKALLLQQYKASARDAKNNVSYATRKCNKMVSDITMTSLAYQDAIKAKNSAEEIRLAYRLTWMRRQEAAARLDGETWAKQEKDDLWHVMLLEESLAKDGPMDQWHESDGEHDSEQEASAS